VSIVHFVGVCLFLSCVLFGEKRLKWVRVNRSERPSQSYTSFCYKVWVSEVNVHEFLPDMLTEFQLALVAAGKSGAVAVYPPVVIDFLTIFVIFYVMAFDLFSADPPCVLSYDAHGPDLFCADFPFGSWAGVLETVFHSVSTWLTQHSSALICCPYHPQEPYYATPRPPPYPPFFYGQADTSFHGVEARWRKLIANRSIVGHHWVSMSITAGKK